MAIHRTKLPSPTDPPDALIRVFATVNLIGSSPAFIEMLRSICRYADCEVPILIQGETFKLAKSCAVAEFERSYLREMLARTSGNVSLAARLAKKDRGAFNKPVKKHGLDGVGAA